MIYNNILNFTIFIKKFIKLNFIKKYSNQLLIKGL